VLNVRSIRALCRTYRGDWSGLEEEWEEATPLAGRAPGALRLGLLFLARALADLWLGRPAPPVPPPENLYAGIPQGRIDAVAAAGLLAAERGHPQARALLATAQEQHPVSGVGVNWLGASLALAAGWARRGDRERSAVWYEPLRPYRGTLLVGAADLVLARIATTNAWWEEGRRHVDRAVRLARREALRPLLALALEARAAIARGGAPRRAAAAADREARGLRDLLGMPGSIRPPQGGDTP